MEKTRIRGHYNCFSVMSRAFKNMVPKEHFVYVFKFQWLDTHLIIFNAVIGIKICKFTINVTAVNKGNFNSVKAAIFIYLLC